MYLPCFTLCDFSLGFRGVGCRRTVRVTPTVCTDRAVGLEQIRNRIAPCELSLNPPSSKSAHPLSSRWVIHKFGNCTRIFTHVVPGYVQSGISCAETMLRQIKGDDRFRH